MDNSKIRQAYTKHLLEHGSRPASVFAFAKSLKLSEEKFYEYYTSFDAIDSDIWLSIYIETRDALRADSAYNEYSAKEKMLAFYFLWTQKLKANRSYILVQQEQLKLPQMNILTLDAFRTSFGEYAEGIINEGIASGEIASRKLVTGRYPDGLWLATVFILNYWIHDRSIGFEQTDAAIEKAVTLAFELIGSNTLDALFDFGKFLIQK